MPVVRGNFDEIDRKAFENYLLELVREYAAEADRLYRLAKNKEPNPLVLEVELKGEYPDTLMRIRCFDRVRDIEGWSVYPFWKSDNFFDEEGRRVCSPERMAGDMLMWALGG